jgi:hypothetical protein
MKHTRHIVYRITVQGRLDASWAEWFSGMTIQAQDMPNGTVITALTGPIADQAALRGVLTKLWNLNLAVISVEQVG